MGSKREYQVKRKSQQNVLFKTDLKMPEGPKLTELTCKRLLQFTTVSSLLLPFFLEYESDRWQILTLHH